MFKRKTSIYQESKKIIVRIILIFLILNILGLLAIACYFLRSNGTQYNALAIADKTSLLEIQEELDDFVLLIHNSSEKEKQYLFNHQLLPKYIHRVTSNTTILYEKNNAIDDVLIYTYPYQEVDYQLMINLSELLPPIKEIGMKRVIVSENDYHQLSEQKYTFTINHRFYFQDTPHYVVYQISYTDVLILFMHQYLPFIIIEGVFLLLVLTLLIYHLLRKLYLPTKHLLKEFKHYSEMSLNSITDQLETYHQYEEIHQILSYFERFCKNNQMLHHNELKELNNQLLQAKASNQSKSLYLANMSHEMRTPLNSIIGYSQLIDRIGFDDLLKVQEYFNRIRVSSDILLQKINDILDLAKIEANQFELITEPSQIRILVKEVYDLLSITANKKGLQFNYYIDPQIPNNLMIDPIRFKQILINLCSNAIKFTNEGEVNLEIELFGYINESIVLDYKVSDTGVGIDSDELDKIFIPFIQVGRNDSAHQGTGLGLTITKDLIKLMGGELSVTSKRGVGTIFSFTTIFEVGDYLNRSTESSEPTDDEISKLIKNQKILVVEDNVINQMLIKEVMKVFDKEDIDSAEDGFVAIEMCQENNYDLIFMDIQMPRCNGVEATLKLRSMPNYQTTPIVALTANAFSEQVNEYLALGMSDYLKKPLDIVQLKKVLYQQLSHKE